MSLALALTALVGTAGVASAQTLPYELGISAPTTVFVDEEFTVRVEIIYDNLPATGCASTASVTLTLRGPGIRQYEDEAVAAVATFRVALGSAGTWNLTAEVLGEQCSGADFEFASHELTVVSGIPPGQPVAPCPSGRECEQVWNGGNTAATLIARSGSFIDPKFVSNSALSCNGGHLEPNSVLSFDHDGNVPKLVKFALDRSLIDKPLWRYRVCWYSDMKFIPRGGGQPVNKGLLRNCRPGVKAPCVLNKRWVRGGALIVVWVPRGDPKGYAR